MFMLDFIERKRDGSRHTDEELRDFVAAVRDDLVPDYQTSAWLMATYFNGLDRGEVAAFTEALAFSGDVVRLPDGVRAVDKHSTGGVGDKTTLIVGPIVAACGLNVAKLSGRGLGFTGGTVDKLESIPGMNMHMTTEQFIGQVTQLGIAMSGHSLALAPAEGKFYALRDVTGTVPSLPLIASSIVSKKIAGGADGFVFDVKCGAGAFMQTAEDARSLAHALTELSATLGKRSVCLISDMEQPLGEWVGNAVEVLEAVQVLSGGGPDDTRELCLALASEMLLLGGIVPDATAGRAMAAEKLEGGAALAKLADMIRAQGGDAAVCREPEAVLPKASERYVLKSPRDGYVARMDARAIGHAVRALGGGRVRKEDAVDPGVGIRIPKKIGMAIREGEPLLEFHYNADLQLASALPYVENACEVADWAMPRTLVHDRVS